MILIKIENNNTFKKAEMNICYLLQILRSAEINNIIHILQMVYKYNSCQIIDILLDNNCTIKKDGALNDIRTIILVDKYNNTLTLTSTRVFDNKLSKLISTIEYINIIYCIGNLH